MASIEAAALGDIHKDTTPEDAGQTILDMKAGASPISGDAEQVPAPRGTCSASPSPMIARRVQAKYRELQVP